MTSVLRPAVSIFVALTLITGVAYPVVVTLIAQGAFPHQANGSLIPRDSESDAESDDPRINIRDWWGRPDVSDNEAAQHALGSALIGQPFTSPKYFWGRPSATGPTPYNGAASTGSNYGPTNPAQIDAVTQRGAALRAAQEDDKSPIPVELVTASASGLDPHVSPAAADYQVPRVAKARGLGEYEVRRLVAEHVETRTFGLLGEPRINVLLLNLALDKLEPSEN
jgi:K+-transporting ATPase ATPase C chain